MWDGKESIFHAWKTKNSGFLLDKVGLNTSLPNKCLFTSVYIVKAFSETLARRMYLAVVKWKISLCKYNRMKGHKMLVTG